MLNKIKDWYRGVYVPPPKNDPDSSIVIISPGHYEQSPLAKVLGAIGRAWLAHWQWTIGTVLAIVAIIVSLWKP